MVTHQLQPRLALNKAFRKVKPVRKEVEEFQKALNNILTLVNETEHESNYISLIKNFLGGIYGSKHHIAPRKYTDLVIYNGKTPKSEVGVIIEVKTPINKSEMVKKDQLNTKAFQELLLYFLRERITQKNLLVHHLIVTNIYEWFVFDSTEFEREFIQKNKNLVKQFIAFEEGRLSGQTTEYFYKNIAQPAIEQSMITFTYVDVRQNNHLLTKSPEPHDKDLAILFKLFSPEHLLKLPFTNDSNSLNKTFYNELLHILGLEEGKDKESKKIIDRKPIDKRYLGSLLENTIEQLRSLNKIAKLENRTLYGEDEEKQFFNVALDLVITWVNRILFLKLLETQIIKYHKSDNSFAFLKSDKNICYSDLDRLFFQVLARPKNERHPNIRDNFAHVPYLNSTLFEPTELENQTITLSNLQIDEIPIFGNTVLTDSQGKKLNGNLTTLDYLFKFLNAYDFSSEGAEEIQENNKGLINAAVLGLIFEKINGYQDGSYFTPGFITMYMCRETIRKAVVQKFNEVKGWKCENIEQLYDKIQDKQEANQIINSVKICDPAVGSGHFLVSALNEMITIKSELKILCDLQGRTLRDYHFEVENDELVIIDDDGQFFEYNFNSRESQRIQEALFHEKQTIIENCLFGVDINPKSVKICQLRLWIELLKNAYYKNDHELETLPNIDINIKQGNSLISQFPINNNTQFTSLRNQISIIDYQKAVQEYRHAQDKGRKQDVEIMINQIKKRIETEIVSNKLRVLRKELAEQEGELERLRNQLALFEPNKTDAKIQKQYQTKIEELKTEIEKTERGSIYDNSFEWYIEFPEILSNEGNFIGFDVVISNPPYIRHEKLGKQKPYLQTNFKTFPNSADLYAYFVDQAFRLLKPSGHFAYIMPNKWMQAGYGKSLKSILLENKLEIIVDFADLQLFDGATTYTCVVIASKQEKTESFLSATVGTLKYSSKFEDFIKNVWHKIPTNKLDLDPWVISSSIELELHLRLKRQFSSLANYLGGEAYYGVKTGLTKAFVIENEQEKDQLILEDKRSQILLKPLVEGGDMSKWYVSSKVSKWLIGTFPSLSLDIEQYPAIKKHLFSFGEKKLEQSGKKGSRKKTSHQWFETQDSINYWQEFEKPKIMYQVFQVKPCFIYDENGLYANNSVWIIPKSDKVLLAILNSKMGWWLISKYCSRIRGGYQLIWDYFGQIPIASANDEQTVQINLLVDKILDLKKNDPNSDVSELENQLDDLIYKLYKLTPEEEIFIKNISN